MAKRKKVVKKTKKRAVKRAKRPVNTRKGTRRKVMQTRQIRSSGRKIRLVLGNLVLFTILLIVSLVLFMLFEGLGNSILTDLFLLLSLIFGVVIVAFFLVLLVLLLLKLMKK